MNKQELVAELRNLIDNQEGEFTPEAADKAVELRTAIEAIDTAQESTEVAVEASADTAKVQEETRASNSSTFQIVNKMENYKKNLLGEALVRMTKNTAGTFGDNVDTFISESRSGNGLDINFDTLAGYTAEARATSGVDTTSAGVDNDASAFVPTNVGPAQYILRPKSIFDKLDCQVLTGLTGNMSIPVGAVVTGGTIDEGVAVTPSMGDVSARSLTPQRLSAGVELTDQIQMQGGAAVEAFVRNNIMRHLGGQKDAFLLAALKNGLTATTFANDLTAQATLRTLEVALMESEGDLDNAEAILDPNGLGFFREAGLLANYAQLANNRGLGDYNSVATTRMTDNEIIFGNFNDFVIGEYQGMRFEVERDALRGVDTVVGSMYTSATRINDGSFAYYDSIGATAA